MALYCAHLTVDGLGGTQRIVFEMPDDATPEEIDAAAADVAMNRVDIWWTPATDRADLIDEEAT